MPRIIHERDSRILSQGVHHVTIARIDEVSHPSDPERPQLQVELVSVRGPKNGKKYVRFWSPPTLDDKDKLKSLAEAAYGRSLTRGELFGGIDIDSLIDLPLKVEIKETVGRSGRHYSKVVRVMPINREL